MNSEAAKNPVLDVRKELEALRDRYKQAAHIHHAHGDDVEANIYEGRSMDMQELLQRIPEGWDMRPRAKPKSCAQCGGTGTERLSGDRRYIPCTACEGKGS